MGNALWPLAILSAFALALGLVAFAMERLGRYHRALKRIANDDWKGGAWCNAVARHALGLPPAVDAVDD